MAGFTFVQAPLFSLPFVLLEDRLDTKSDARLFRDPVEIVVCDDPGMIEESWDRVEQGLSRGLYAAGFFSFELGYCLEPKLRPLLHVQRPVPLFWLGLFPKLEAIQQRTLDAGFAELGPPDPVGRVNPAIEKSLYLLRVRDVLAQITDGDVYQINLTLPLEFTYSGDPLRLYGALRVSQPVAHGGMIRLPGVSVLSVSPELFISVADGKAITRPMKGTAPRGDTAEDDRAASAALRADPKERAENLMIVDLLRNDLSRVSDAGSVQVPRLFSVETFPTLHTMTSTVTSTLRAGTKLRDIVQALFPCGSIVGAPKHHAMEIVRSLESEPRGVYTGAIGAIHPNGDLKLNVAIRTATVDDTGRGTYGVGGGIVSDSVPEAEWRECLLKGRVLTDLASDYGLIETLRWSASNGFCRLDMHLDRLRQSSLALEFAFEEDAIEAALADQISSMNGSDRRIRLVLSRHGGIDVSSAELPTKSNDLRVSLSAVRLDAGDPYLRHKTTRRERYDSAFAAAAEQGSDEAILLNNHGDVADACRNTVFVERDGVLVTPPLASGALAGVLRQSLLATGEAEERILTWDDIVNARRLFVGNSLHGLRRAWLAEAG